MSVDQPNPEVPAQDALPPPRPSHLLSLVFLLAFGVLVGGAVLLNLQPNPQALYSKAQEAAKQRDFDAALKYLNQAIEASPGYLEAHELRAQMYYAKKDYGSALAEYNRLIPLRPGDGYLYAGRGMCYCALGEFDKALADHHEAVWREPRSAVVICGRGETHVARRDYKLAIADFTAAIALSPAYFGPFLSRGRAYSTMEEYDKALVDLDKAIQLKPDNDASYLARAYVFEARRQFPQAAADYRAVIRLSPHIPDGYNSLAWLLATCPAARLRNGLEAVELATKACTLTSWQDGLCLDTLAAAYAEAGNFPEAVKWQRKSLEYPEDDPEELEKARQRLALFEAGQPYRQE